jgi:hypothetical protein
MQWIIRFNPEQIEILEDLLTGVEDRGLHMLPALNRVVDLYLEQQRAIFAGDNHWAPLTPGTVAAKERSGFTTPLVGTTGVLKGSVSRRAGGSTGASSIATDTYALMGTHAYHAHLQALGTAERVQRTTGRRTGKVTPRQFAFFGEDLRLAAYEILESYLVNGGFVAAPEGVATTGTVDLGSWDVPDGGLGI